MRVILIVAFLLVHQFIVGQQVYKYLKGRVDFSSVKGMNLLEAYSESLYLKFEPKSKELNLKVQVTSFSFTNCSKSVEKTFNDIYLESHKHHWAKFEGKILDSLDLNITGSNEVVAEGKFSLHGVDIQRKIKGTITVKDQEKLVFTAKFPVALVDHKIVILSEDVDRLATEVEVKVYAEAYLIK